MLPKPSFDPAPIRPLSARLSLSVVAGLAALVLASCVLHNDHPQTSDARARPGDARPHPGDTRTHPGVARALTRPIRGVDVSKWQGKIDWASVRSAGTHFAFIKATEGGDRVDDRFLENWHGARRAGVPRGAYHFMYWCRPVHEQAALFKRTVPNDPDALPPVLDLEWNGHSPTCPIKLPRETALAKIRPMLQEIEAHTGKRPIIYTDITFHREVLEGALSEYPHWLRSVAAEPHERYANRPWFIWQYTTTGRVPGIQGDVDLNAFYGGKAEWAKFLATSCDPRLAARGACNGQGLASAQ